MRRYMTDHESLSHLYQEAAIFECCCCKIVSKIMQLVVVSGRTWRVDDEE